MSMQYTTCHEDTPCRGAGDMMKAQIHEGDTDRVSMPCWGLCTYWSGATVPYYSIDSSSSSSFGEKVIFRGPRSSSSSLRGSAEFTARVLASMHLPSHGRTGTAGTAEQTKKRVRSKISLLLTRHPSCPAWTSSHSPHHAARSSSARGISARTPSAGSGTDSDQPGPDSSHSGRITNAPVPDILMKSAGQGIGEG